MSRRALATRVGFGVADQAIASLSTFLLGVGVARSSTPDEFGAFSIAFSAYLVLFVTARALVSEPFLIRVSGQPRAVWRRAAADATGATLLISALGVAAFLAAGAAIGGAIGLAMVAFALVAPPVLLADSWRFVLIADARPAAAFACNAAWTSVFLAALLAIERSGLHEMAAPLLAWGGAALVGAVLGGVFARVLPLLTKGPAYLRQHSDLGPRYLIEALIGVAAPQLIIIAVGVAAGLAASAALRGAQILLGPAQILFMGIVIVGVPEGVRIARGGTHRLMRPAIGVSVLLMTVCLVLALVLPNLPSEIGEALLGPTWEGTQQVVALVAVAFAGLTASTGAGIGLRVLADAKRSLRARAAAAASQTIWGVGGAFANGLSGAAAGLAVGSWLASAFVWRAFVVSLHARSPEVEPVVGGGSGQGGDRAQLGSRTGHPGTAQSGSP